MTANIEQVKQLISQLAPEQQSEVLRFVRELLPRHPLEQQLNIEAEALMDAISRADELIMRNIRGVIAEAAFGFYVLGNPGSTYVTLESFPDDDAFADYVIGNLNQRIRVQVKLQRSEKRQPKVLGNGCYAVEVQRTRTGIKEVKSKSAEGHDTIINEATRPYRYGQFDILAVNMYPSTGDWSRFMYTLARWLLVNPTDNSKIKVMQPIPRMVNADWTDDLATCIAWFNSDTEKLIANPPPPLKSPRQPK